MLSFIEAHEQGYSQAAWTEVDGVHMLAGNPFVVVALFLDRKSQGVSSAFLVSLAFADVLFLVICIPYELISKFLFFWFGGRALCKVAGFTEMLTGFASVLNLTAVSIERSVIYHINILLQQI